jgi:hypothetical protein
MARARGGWLTDARKSREGEVIGGGWIVLRIGKITGRYQMPMWAFEHRSHAEAITQARALAIAHPGERFAVLGQSDEIGPIDPAPIFPDPVCAPAPAAAPETEEPFA